LTIPPASPSDETNRAKRRKVRAYQVVNKRFSYEKGDIATMEARHEQQRRVQAFLEHEYDIQRWRRGTTAAVTATGTGTEQTMYSFFPVPVSDNNTVALAAPNAAPDVWSCSSTTAQPGSRSGCLSLVPASQNPEDEDGEELFCRESPVHTPVLPNLLRHHHGDHGHGLVINEDRSLDLLVDLIYHHVTHEIQEYDQELEQQEQQEQQRKQQQETYHHHATYLMNTPTNDGVVSGGVSDFYPETAKTTTKTTAATPATRQ
jgi:hypothetical protein